MVTGYVLYITFFSIAEGSSYVCFAVIQIKSLKKKMIAKWTAGGIEKSFKFPLFKSAKNYVKELVMANEKHMCLSRIINNFCEKLLVGQYADINLLFFSFGINQYRISVCL